MNVFILFLFILFPNLILSKIILTIFSGRRQFIEILRNYLNILLNNKIINEIHFFVHENYNV